MPNRPQPFRQHHVRRALKAASDAGVPDPAVCIRLPGGAELTVGAGAAVGRPTAAAIVKPGKPDVAAARKASAPLRGRR